MKRFQYFGWICIACILLIFADRLDAVQPRPLFAADGRTLACTLDSLQLPITAMTQQQADSLRQRADSIAAARRDSVIAHIDSVALAMPASFTKDVKVMAYYIREKFATPRERVQAIYTWISHNIKYKVYEEFHASSQAYVKADEIKKTLATREGICRDYVWLFQSLCHEVRIPCHEVLGYNRAGDRLMPNEHVWCAAKLEDRWWMFDPTWGSGYVDNYKFVSSPNKKYFMLTPRQMMDTHLPFDPLWQMTEEPVPYAVFDMGVPIGEGRQVPLGQWEKTLADHQALDTLPRFEAEKTRIKQMISDKPNPLVHNHLLWIEHHIWVQKLQLFVDRYNEVQAAYDVAADSLNRFISHRNKQDFLRMPTSRVVHLLDVSDSLVTYADTLSKRIREVPEKYHKPMTDLNEAITDLQVRVYQERMFVEVYLAWPEKKRPDLFLVGGYEKARLRLKEQAEKEARKRAKEKEKERN